MSKGRINFNAGPAALPAIVKQQIAEAVLNYDDSGVSILELPHRGKHFKTILDECNSLMHKLCNVGDDYEFIWLQGGGRMQFCMVPMNFLSHNTTAQYTDTGHWAYEAIAYAKHYGNVVTAGSSRAANYNYLPHWEDISGVKYAHITTNNTIYGTQYKNDIQSSAPLVADMSSDILGIQRDYNNYALFYAAAQKNLGTPGVAVVGIKKEFLATASSQLPPMLSYLAQAREYSILNTANVSGVYTTLLMLRWIANTGLDNIIAANHRKASMLYKAIDNSHVFVPHVKELHSRSIMNITFTAQNKEWEQKFVDYCKNEGILGIEGHRSVGGFRVSLYNAITEQEVKILVDIISAFEEKL